MLVFRTPQSVANLLRGTMKVGVDASAAAGPVGRQTSAGTDLQLQAEILSYSRARGAFVGVSIDGSVISLDPSAEAIYYQPPGAVPASAVQLLQTVSGVLGRRSGGRVVPGQAAAAGGWVPAGQGGGDAEAARQQLDRSSRQLLRATSTTSWKRYLALPPEVYTPNQVPNPQALQQATSRLRRRVAPTRIRGPSTRGPSSRKRCARCKRLGEVRTASNTSLQLPPPPR